MVTFIENSLVYYVTATVVATQFKKKRLKTVFVLKLIRKWGFINTFKNDALDLFI